ncbi:MAG TPA: DUF2147 domain-containing protein [Solimonas sp.]
MQAIRIATADMRTALLVLTCLFAGLLPPSVWAADGGPVGTWKTVDDKTGKEKALIEIRERSGVLHGRIVHLFDPSKPNPLCEKCEGERRDQPIRGLEVLWGLKPDGDHWSGGQILDPEEGQIYKASLRLADGGEALEVRGYIGVSLLGRTQTWVRYTAAGAGRRANGEQP